MCKALRFQYLAVVDFDEILTPTGKHTSLIEVMETITKGLKTSNITAETVSFQQYLFPDQGCPNFWKRSNTMSSECDKRTLRNGSGTYTIQTKTDELNIPLFFPFCALR